MCSEKPQLCNLPLNVEVLGVIQWLIRSKPQRLVVKKHVAQPAVVVMGARLEIAGAAVAVMGAVAVIHTLLIAVVFITAAVFETARRKPQFFGGLGRGNGGEHD